MRGRSQWENGPSLPVLVLLRFPSTIDPFAYSSNLCLWTLYPFLASLPFLAHSPCSLPQLPGSPQEAPCTQLSSQVLLWGNPTKMPSLFPVSDEDLAWLCFLPSLSELQNVPWRRAWKEGLLFTEHVLCARQCAQGNRVRMIGLIPQQKTLLLMVLA